MRPLVKGHLVTSKDKILWLSERHLRETELDCVEYKNLFLLSLKPPYSTWRRCFPRLACPLPPLHVGSLPVSEWQQAVLPFRSALGFSCRHTRARHHSQCFRTWQQLWTQIRRPG